MEKNQLRREIRNRKKQLTEDDIHNRTIKILHNFFNSFDNNGLMNNVFTYVNYNQEVDTSILINKLLSEDKNVYVPRVNGDSMEFYRIYSMNDLSLSDMNILEPDEFAKPALSHQGIMIMPGLAFDRNFNRLGYGGGFYDKYLEMHKDFFKVALCYDFQVVDSIETSEYDIPVDMIITENEIIESIRGEKL